MPSERRFVRRWATGALCVAAWVCRRMCCASLDVKVRIAKSIQSLKEDVVKGNVTLVAAEAENENDKKKLQSAEKVVGNICGGSLQ